MIDNYEHYISKNIKLFYKRRLVAPMIYLVLLVTMWFVFPLQNMLRPVPIMETDSFQEVYKHSKHYVKTTFTDLHFTGYTSERGNKTKGYYYYTIKNDIVVILLQAGDKSDQQKDIAIAKSYLKHFGNGFGMDPGRPYEIYGNVLL